MKISDSTSISMPMRNLLSIIGAVAVGVWAYFGVVERLNKLETGQVLIEKDMIAEDERLHSEVTKNTDFRIKAQRTLWSIWIALLGMIGKMIFWD